MSGIVSAKHPAQFGSAAFGGRDMCSDTSSPLLDRMRAHWLFVAVLAAICGSPCLAAEATGPAPDAGQRVFVTAHSFHIFVADRLAPLAKAAGITGHELIGKQMLGGSRVRQHWDLADRMNPAKKALIAGDVDVLTMSPNWMVPDDGIALFTDLGLKHNPQLRGLVQMSWPAFDHWEPIGNPALWNPAKKINHNDERDARSLDGPRAVNAGAKAVIENQIASLNAKYGRDVIHVVPVGDAVLRLRERVAAGNVPGIKRQSELFTDPIGHAKAPVMALATYCNFACIYGRSPVGLDDGARELDRIDPSLRRVLQEIAWDAVTSHPMSGVTKDGLTSERPAKESPRKEGVPKDNAGRSSSPTSVDSSSSTPATGVPITYTLPTDGPLPKTYRVTLAITDASAPDWIVSSFLSGEPRTVTAENKGRFTDTWDGLDDNFMPAPPGTYGVKGIFLPAETWAGDGKPHTLTAKLAGGPFAFLPRPDQDMQPPKVHGDPVNSPPGDVGTFGESAVFTWTYLENGTNNFVLDLKKPVGLDQIVGSFNSGGAAGGPWNATDGSGVWTVGEDFGRSFIYKAQGKWGPDRAMYREGVVLLDGVACGLAASRESDRSFVYVAEAVKVEMKGKDRAGRDTWGEADSRIDRVTVLDGENGKKLAAVDLPSPVAITVRNGTLFALQQLGDTFAVRSMKLAQGLPAGEWSAPVVLAGVKAPADLDVDTSGRIYVADPTANHVFVFGENGKSLRTIGKAESQMPGHYDRLTLMRPRRVSCWHDGKRDLAIIMEGDGPGRFAEWSSDGELIREWQGLVPHANNGYAEDPAHPDHIYIQGHGEYLLRFAISNETGQWTLDAVWPHVTGDLGGTWRGEGSFPRMIRRDGRLYLAYGRGLSVYRFDGDRCLASAALVLKVDGKNRNYFAWHDANGDGTIQEGEVGAEKIEVPRGVFGYHGDGWQHDFSLLCPGEGTRDIWRLAPESFDAHGNPVFASFKRLLTDPIMAAKAAGNAPALRGGNEVSDTINSAWRRVVLTSNGEVLTDIRCGALSANHGTEQKISRYVPDGKGGYDIRWRIGRSANIRASRDGFVGSIQMTEPLHGLIGVVDQSRAGVQVFTADEGLYVDTLLLDGSFSRQTIYGAPGEFFSGGGFLNNETGKVFIKWGKHTPILFEAVGWTKDLAIRRIAGLPKEVTLTAAQTAPPPPMAMVVRGGAGKAPYARFQPSPGGPPALDGAIDGWESCEAITFGEGECKVEVRGMYDLDHLYLRWHVRSDAPIRVRPLEPADRLFTHDRGADTLGLYFQGSPSATGNDPAGRPGDLRLIVGLFEDAGKTVPTALSMYPSWNGPGPHPVTYGSPVGKTSLAHVALATQVRLAHRLDAGGKGLTLAAAIPRSVLPAETPDWSEGLRTTIDFDANFGGNRKLWWSNADGSASRETNDEPTEARLYPGAWGPLELAPLSRGLYVRQWQVIGPFGFGKLPQLDVRSGRGQICATLADLKFPPELQGDARDGGSAAVLVRRDLSGRYEGDMARTRKMNRVLTWMPVTITDDEVDFRKIARLKWTMHDEEGVAYMVTWIHAADATDVTLTIPEVHGHRAVRGWLNGDPLPATLGEGKRAADLRQRIDASRPMSLRKGWNELLIRVDHIWGDSEIAVRLDAPATTLWKLRTSNEQPEE